MDFYYAMTNYHIICCLLHKMCINKNKAGLYISSFLRYNQPYIVENIINSGIFEEVHFYEELEFKKTKKIMDSSMIDDEIKRICKEVQKAVGSKIKAAKKIYICSDFYSIGLYIITNKIKYNYFEDGCGIMSRPYIPMRIIEKENPNRAKIIKKIKAFGENENVINRYANLKTQEKGYFNEKDIDFSVKDLLKKLSIDKINMILKIYNVKKINLKNKKAILLLTMHYNELFSINNQKDIYTNLIDYFSDANQELVIKPHPADTIWDYDKLFKGCKIINRYMPAELFPYCINNTFEKGITCWSTSIYSLESILKKTINFDIRIDKTYKDMDKYYAIVEYLKQIKKEDKINIICKNINEIQLERLLEKYIKYYKKFFTFNEDKKDSVYIVDKIDEKIKKEKVISLEYDLNATQLLHINKKTPKHNEDLFIGIYNIDYIGPINIKKHLYYSNIDITISNINEANYKEALYYVVKNQNKNIQKIIEKYEQETSKLEEKIVERDNNLNSIYTSTSWKVTVPLRKFADILRKIKK